MSSADYQSLPPRVGESAADFGRRLQDLGHEEMFIRKALHHHLGVDRAGMPALLNELETARLRYLTQIRRINPDKTVQGLANKAAKSLGISTELASIWLRRLDELGDISSPDNADPDENSEKENK